MQAANFFEAAEQHAVALGTARRLKAELDMIKNEVAADVRLNPEAFMLAKTTESAINEVVSNHKRVIEGIEAQIKADEALAHAAALRDAWMQRASMLRAEVDLQYGTYHSPEANPSAKMKAAEAVEKRIIDTRRAAADDNKRPKRRQRATKASVEE